MKKRLSRRNWVVVVVVSALSGINPLNREWFESQGFGWFAAMLFAALIFGTIFGFLLWIFGFYRQSKN